MGCDSDKEKKESHYSFPDPRCELYFKGVIEPMIIALKENSLALQAVSKQLEVTARAVHGEHMDNGIVADVRELRQEMKTAVNDLKNQNREVDVLREDVDNSIQVLQRRMDSWVMKMFGVYIAVTAISLTILGAIVKMELQKNDRVSAQIEYHSQGK